MEAGMIDFLFALGQFLCVVGLIYGGLLAAARIDWLEDLPAGSLKCDPLTGHDTVSAGKAAAERCSARVRQLRAL